MKRYAPLLALALTACSIGMVEERGVVTPVALEETATEGPVTCTASGHYLQVTNLMSRQVEVNINGYFDDFAFRVKRDIAACPGLMKDLVTEEAAFTDATTVRYDVKLLNQQYLSVVLTRSQYFEGAAHPNNTIETLTFDLRDGQPVTLKSLFKEGTDIESLLTEHIRTTLKKERVQSAYPSETSKPMEKFYLTETALVLTDLFDVYALQGMTVEIPLTELTEVLVTPRQLVSS